MFGHFSSIFKLILLNGEILDSFQGGPWIRFLEYVVTHFPVLRLIDWQLFFVKELIILTPTGVDFTAIPVIESCVSQSLGCIF